MGRSFVLGAGGFLGHRLASTLAGQGENPVLAGLRTPLMLEGPADQIVTGHLTSFEGLDPYAGEGDIYYYLIASMTPSNSSHEPSNFISGNLELFIRFLEWAEQRPGARVVYASSGGTVYGNAAIIPTPETEPMRPISFYGLVKSTCERYLNLFSEQGRIESSIVRIANPFGAGQKLNRGQGLIPALVGRIREGDPVDIIGEGRAVRDYIHVDDVVRAMLLAGAHPSMAGQTVNVATGYGASVMEVLELVQEVLGLEAKLNYHPHRPGDVEISVLDPSRLKALTGWSPEYDLESGLRACL